ncbi:sporulation protein YpjB [Alkalihalobacillus trypoxylicola]|uniref:Sporulation protein YpjB n=1 Tax=Alkalihalobacillus trypoxylicola TaxID=519424 RepID=A0A161PH32_9BACI|nr:sporulation protein YpjB [Alkalihalobacillus trypoxylicola]KYG32878.1 sporulation protein YpjB [Alkalihalobacillus trypoxylicola]
MRRAFFVFGIVWTTILLFPLMAMAEEDTKETWKELNQTSDQILQLVKQEKYEDAKKLIGYFSDVFLRLDFKAEGLTMNDLRTVTITVDKANEALASVDMSYSERVHEVTSFRLAVDALSSDFHPLWLYTEDTIMTVLQHLTENIKEGSAQTFQHGLNEFLYQYKMVRPALLIDLEPMQLQKIESQIKFLESLRVDVTNQEVILNHLESMISEWESLYQQVKEEQADPSLLWVIITIGGMIFFSLSYVGWKKYKAEKEKSDKIRAKE